MNRERTINDIFYPYRDGPFNSLFKRGGWVTLRQEYRASDWPQIIPCKLNKVIVPNSEKNIISQVRLPKKSPNLPIWKKSNGLNVLWQKHASTSLDIALKCSQRYHIINCITLVVIESTEKIMPKIQTWPKWVGNVCSITSF